MMKPTSLVERLLRIIDATNEKLGQALAIFLIPLALITLTEVVLRYLFNSPTIWVWDINLQIFGVIVLLGVGFTLLRGRHVRISALLIFSPVKVTRIFDLLAMSMVMFVAVILTWQGALEGWDAFIDKEKLNTVWAPYIFQIKMLYPLSGTLLFLQAMVKFVRNILTFNEPGGFEIAD